MLNLLRYCLLTLIAMTTAAVNALTIIPITSQIVPINAAPPIAALPAISLRVLEGTSPLSNQIVSFALIANGVSFSTGSNELSVFTDENGTASLPVTTLTTNVAVVDTIFNVRVQVVNGNQRAAIYYLAYFSPPIPNGVDACSESTRIFELLPGSENPLSFTARYELSTGMQLDGDLTLLDRYQILSRIPTASRLLFSASIDNDGQTHAIRLTRIAACGLKFSNEIDLPLTSAPLSVPTTNPIVLVVAMFSLIFVALSHWR
jgi:hypothetical protein